MEKRRIRKKKYKFIFSLYKFFKFHNFKLISGSFFSSDDVNHRSIVLDKDAAWKMFGAINVNGMTLEFDGEEYQEDSMITEEEI